ncbi:MAG: S-layer homology domain-containing protein, partial [Peptococcaceae bacterium]|nr:S-layer homology domain-containing protein [Peptococcaceae bacterium]
DGRQLVNDYVAVNKSLVEVIVTFPDVVTVTLNGVQMASQGADQFVGNATLKSGNNAVSIEVTDVSGAVTTHDITINYLNLLQAGASVTADLPPKGKLDLFSKQLSLNLVQGTYLKDPDDATGLPIADQSIVFGIATESMPDGFPSVSLVYDIAPTVTDAVMTNSGEGKITISFDKYVSSTSSSTLTVLLDSDSNGTWEENLGGKVDTAKRTITVPFSSFGRYVVVNRVWNFSDYDTTGWAKPYVEYLWAKGYMSPAASAGISEFGITDAYGQEVPITRGEFAVLVAKSLGYNKGNYANYGIFTDMRLFESSNPPYGLAKDLNGNWTRISNDDFKYIDMLARNGIIYGMLDEYGEMVFDYFDIISREQVAIILARAMNLKVETDEAKYNAAITKMYVDANESIGGWAQPFVVAASKGYFGGFPDSTFRGKDNFTRAQAARIVYLAMQKNKMI